MLKQEATTKAKSYYDEKMQSLRDEGYIYLLNPKDPETYKGFFLEAFTVHNERKTTSALRLVFNARALFMHEGQPKSLNSSILNCPNNMIELVAVLLKMSQHSILVCGDIRHFFLRVKVPERDRHYLKILWRDQIDRDSR